MRMSELEKFANESVGTLPYGFSEEYIVPEMKLCKRIFDAFDKYYQHKDLDVFGRSQSVQTAVQDGIKGITEETASVLMEQLNAVRIHTASIADYTGMTVFQLTQIAHYTSFDKYLVDRKDSLVKFERGNNFRVVIRERRL